MAFILRSNSGSGNAPTLLHQVFVRSQDQENHTDAAGNTSNELGRISEILDNNEAEMNEKEEEERALSPSDEIQLDEDEDISLNEANDGTLSTDNDSTGGFIIPQPLSIVSLSHNPFVFEKISRAHIKQEYLSANLQQQHPALEPHSVQSPSSKTSTRLQSPFTLEDARQGKKFDPKMGYYFSCPRCDKKYVSASCIVEHLTYCGKKDENIIGNMPAPLVRQPQLYYCTKEGCKSKGYKNEYDLVRFHVNPIHYAVGSTPFKCKYCGKILNHRSSLIRHIRLCHSDIAEEMGDKDFRSTARPASAMRQLRDRPGPRDIDSGISEFSPAGPEPSCLTTGYSNGNTGTNPNVISHDRASDPKGSDELNSIARKRTGRLSKKLECDTCSESFSTVIDLETHSLTHRIDIEKPYSCGFCDKTFFLKAYLLEHEKSHIEEYPFVCPVCRECFTNQTEFDEHVKVHRSSVVSIRNFPNSVSSAEEVATCDVVVES